MAEEPTTVAEIEAAIKRANDKERIIGLIAAPVAAAIVFLVMSSLVHNDPSALLANGAANPRHTDPNVYTELGLVTLALALVMLGGAWFRKRLVIGIASALYGLSFFNLHYWGFGVPYIMIGAWYMVRAYRLSQKLNWPRPVMPPRQARAGSGPNPTSDTRPRPPRPAGPPKPTRPRAPKRAEPPLRPAAPVLGRVIS